METNRNNSGLDAGLTGYNPGRDTGDDVRTGPMDSGPGRGAEGGGYGGGSQPVQGAKQFVQKGKQAARDIGQEVSREARGIAQELGQEFKGTAGEMLEQQRQRVTGQVGGFAQALHRVSDELRQDQGGSGGGETVARVTDLIASRLDDAANMLQNKEPRDIIRSVENFARREPALFLGGCLLAGVVISRFLKASSRHEHGYSGGDDYGRDSYSGGSDVGDDVGITWRAQDKLAQDKIGSYGPSGPIDVNPPRGPLDKSGLGGSATPFDVTPKTPETPPDLRGGV
ncbi:MAG TPA: hypothetical protein VD997_12655 [Phycisphaerales bacterium]|nr:hypothetical protein [Phycisphaerales bacterium]